MKSTFTALLFSIIMLPAMAADGDTTRVRAHDSRDITWYSAYDDWGVFPPVGTEYRKVLMHFTIGCASTGCSDWDYTIQLDLRHRTGMLDSTLQQAPNFTVDGAQVATVSYTAEHTYTTVWNGTDTDTLWTDTIQIILFNDAENPFTPTDTLHVFPADLTYDVFDSEGNMTATATFMPEGVLNLALTDIYTVFEVIDDYELGRSITPYGGYMAAGQSGFNNSWTHVYTYDVTEYQHLLHDSVEFRAFYGGWSSGFAVTLDFDLIEGTPPMDVLKVSRIYDSGPNGFSYPNLSTFEANSVPAKNIELMDETVGAIGRMFVTGHQQAGEFTPGVDYTLRVNGTNTGQQEIWKDDCGMNAIYPQAGTWPVDRANWCPGEAVRIFNHNVSQYINPGEVNTVNVDFSSFNASQGASYIMELQLIEHAAPNFSLDAEIIDIITPSIKDVHKRSNPMCGSARIVIRNTGSTALTSLTITYGLVGGTSQTYEWTGNLGFLKSQEVELPVLQTWSGGYREFYATVSNPNGGQDEYAANDSYTSTFQAPDVITDTEAIVLWVQSNNYGNRIKYYVYDDAGNEVYSRTSLASNTLYKDTLYLGNGCYRFHLTALDEYGLQWSFYPEQGSGYARIRKVGSTAIFKNFNADFGSEVSYWFTMGAPLGIAETAVESQFDVYPNPTPAGGRMNVDLTLNQKENVILQVVDMAGRMVWSKNFTAVEAINQEISLNGVGAGMYVMQALTSDGRITKRIVVQ
jgi:hypothetical protein